MTSAVSSQMESSQYHSCWNTHTGERKEMCQNFNSWWRVCVESIWKLIIFSLFFEFEIFEKLKVENEHPHSHFTQYFSSYRLLPRSIHSVAVAEWRLSDSSILFIIKEASNKASVILHKEDFPLAQLLIIIKYCSLRRGNTCLILYLLWIVRIMT